MHELSTIADRINKVLTDNGLVKPNGKPNYAKAERLCAIKGTVLSKAVLRNGTLGDGNKEKFLRTFHVKQSWFDTGIGDAYLPKDAENHTSVPKPSASTETPISQARELIKTLMELEKEGDYRFVPKKIFDDYDLFPKTAIERSAKERDKTIEALERLIASQDREIDDLRSGRMTIVASPKHAQ